MKRLVPLFVSALFLAACTAGEPTPAPTNEVADTPTAAPTRTPTPVPPLGIGSTWVSPVDGMEMVFVPAGQFLMGMEDPGQLSESHAVDLRPPRAVRLGDFWIDRTEVTNGMYALCMADGVCESPSSPLLATRPDYATNPSYADYPVVGVTWENAQRYCEWAGRRLPTEAEWEKAARGEDGHWYPWGNNPPQCETANFAPCNRDTMPVGSLPAGASPYGALHMAGNAWEWVADWYEPEAYATLPPLEGQEQAPVALHVVRGGSWIDGAISLHAGFRFFGYPIDAITIGFGFRCARDASR